MVESSDSEHDLDFAYANHIEPVYKGESQNYDDVQIAQSQTCAHPKIQIQRKTFLLIIVLVTK